MKGPWPSLLKLVLWSTQMPVLPSFLPSSHHASLKRLMRCPTIIIFKILDLRLYSTSTSFIYLWRISWDILRMFSEPSPNWRHQSWRSSHNIIPDSFSNLILMPSQAVCSLIFKSLFGSWRPQQPRANVMCRIEFTLPPLRASVQLCRSCCFSWSSLVFPLDSFGLVFWINSTWTPMHRCVSTIYPII